MREYSLTELRIAAAQQLLTAQISGWLGFAFQLGGFDCDTDFRPI